MEGIAIVRKASLSCSSKSHGRIRSYERHGRSVLHEREKMKEKALRASLLLTLAMASAGILLMSAALNHQERTKQRHHHHEARRGVLTKRVQKHQKALHHVTRQNAWENQQS
eukprot:4804906-Amphidinium_carterae.1